MYQEFIADKHHIHLSGTRWGSVKEFCYYLQRQNIAKVDETDKGIFLTWIDNSPTIREKQEALEKKARLEKSEAEQDEKLLQEMMAKASSSQDVPIVEPTELKRETEQEPIKLQMQMKSNLFQKKPKVELKKLESLAKTGVSMSAAVTGGVKHPVKLSALEEIRREEMQRKGKRPFER